MEGQEVTLYAEQALPPGWEWGAHWSREGASGYYAIAPDGRTVQVRVVPEAAWTYAPEELAAELESAAQ